MIDSYGEHSWTAVAQELHRIPDDCREKWRELRDPDVRTGPWSVEEDATLIFWVLKQSALARATDPEERNALMALRPEDAAMLPEDTPLPASGVMWSTIVTVMHRPHSVCRQRWYFSLLPRLNIGSARLAMQGLRWNRDEDLELIERMWAQGAEHLNEIDWTRCVSSTWPSAPHVYKHFQSLLTRLTSVRRYAPLAKADAPLDTVLRKMRKHMSPAGDPEIFATRTFSSSAQRRRRSYQSAMQVLAAREGDDFAGAMPAEDEADGEEKRRGRKRRRRSGGAEEADSAAVDPAEAAASAEEAARAERQRLRVEAASTAMAQALEAAEEKRRRAQEREEKAARAVAAVRERAEATERAQANRAAALQLYRPVAGAAAASSSSSASPSSPQQPAVSSRANATPRSVAFATATAAVAPVGGASSETSEEEEEEQKRRPPPPRQRAHASGKLAPAQSAAAAAATGASAAAASSSSNGVRAAPRPDKRALQSASAAAAARTSTAAPPKLETIRLQPRW